MEKKARIQHTIMTWTKLKNKFINVDESYVMYLKIVFHDTEWRGLN